MFTLQVDCNGHLYFLKWQIIYVYFLPVFTDVSLQICMNHTLYTFRHDITCEKMLISGSVRDNCLSVLRDMAYSSDETMYNRHVERLEALRCSQVFSQTFYPLSPDMFYDLPSK